MRALNALQLDGLVTGKTSETSSQLEYLVIPVKISASGAAVDLSNKSAVTSVYLKNTTLFDVHKGAKVTDKTTWNDLIGALNLGANEAMFAIYNGNDNTVLEPTEKAFLIIHLGQGYMLGENEIVKIEVRIAKGAALTVERTVTPGLLPKSFVSLG
jgi:archaellin